MLQLSLLLRQVPRPAVASGRVFDDNRLIPCVSKQVNIAAAELEWVLRQEALQARMIIARIGVVEAG
jgi:hypothetical protein